MVLKKLVHVSREDECSFDVVGVVTQPGRPKGRRNKGVPQPSPVEVFAREESLENILCPVKANEEDFLETMKELSPDLCITAAYGNYLPSSFLKIPSLVPLISTHLCCQPTGEPLRFKGRLKMGLRFLV